MEQEHDCATNMLKCNWIEEYYGYRCSQCGDFVPYGCEPWMPVDDDDDDYDDDDYPSYWLPGDML